MNDTILTKQEAEQFLKRYLGDNPTTRYPNWKNKFTREFKNWRKWGFNSKKEYIAAERARLPHWEREAFDSAFGGGR